jgi:hypothetical protein
MYFEPFKKFTMLKETNSITTTNVVNQFRSQAFLKAKRMINNATPVHYKGVLNFVLLFLRKAKCEDEKKEIINLYKEKISQCI